MTKAQIKEYFAKLGRKGGKSRSPAKIAACRATAAARRKVA